MLIHMSDSMNGKLHCAFVDVHLWVCRLPLGLVRQNMHFLVQLIRT